MWVSCVCCSDPGSGGGLTQCGCLVFVAVILAVEVVWLIVGVVWIVQHYASCSASVAKRAVLGTSHFLFLS